MSYPTAALLRAMLFLLQGALVAIVAITRRPIRDASGKLTLSIGRPARSSCLRGASRSPDLSSTRGYESPAVLKSIESKGETTRSLGLERQSEKMDADWARNAARITALVWLALALAATSGVLALVMLTTSH